MSIVSEPLGRVLGNRYRLISALGTGASAHVFLAEDTVLQRRVAVKVLQPALAQDEAFLRRFRAEARSVAAMNHPHVLRVFDWGEDEDGPYLILEYLAGGSLFDMLAMGERLSPAQAARVGAQAAEGLAYAHLRGLVHRDVKPANILFDEEGRVRVADFGVARALALASSDANQRSKTMVGTARYASPEQAEGRPLDGRSDVYSLALVLYEAVTGTVPFTGDSPRAMLQARVGAALPDNPALGPLGEVLSWAARPDAADRPDAATLAMRLEALADDLGAAGPLPLGRQAAPLGTGVGDLTVGLHSTTVAGMALADGADTGEPTGVFRFGGGAASKDATGAPLIRARRRRRRWPWVVLAAVLVGCLVAAGAVYAVRVKLFTPSHRVPSVVGEALPTARRALLADHFHVVVEQGVRSTSVPSGSVVSQSPGKGVSVKEGSTVEVVPSSGEPTVQVPLLSAGGVNCQLADQLLSEAHLKAECPASQIYTKTVHDGDVISWTYGGKLDPKIAPYGATILVTISEGNPPVQVPTLAHTSWTQAASTLEADGLVPKEIQVFSTTVPAGTVVSTTPGAGATVSYGSGIDVSVSKGPRMVTVPNVTGQTVAAATALLKKTGLTVGNVYGPPTGTVFTTVPLAGQQAKAGTAVTLYTQ
jgi:eukaryotic-like serine/threonine-protein kinase